MPFAILFTLLAIGSAGHWDLVAWILGLTALFAVPIFWSCR